MNPRTRFLAFCWTCIACTAAADDGVAVKRLWNETPPGYQVTEGPERNTSGPDSRQVAGRPVIRLGNVATPEIHLYLPEQPNGTSVVVCPGGGFNILAWDLEGTEVASWLNSIGVTAAVLKYRVPTRNADLRWLPPTQDAQRAISMLRSIADQHNLQTDRVGVLGFSAGGHAAARAALATKRLYEPGDEIDNASAQPDFAMLIYPAYLADAAGQLEPGIEVTAKTPPMFFVHAQDDRVTCQSSVQLFSALQQAGVPSELHIYKAGGHGYGLRETDEPVSRWPRAAEAWLRSSGLLTK